MAAIQEQEMGRRLGQPIPLGEEVDNRIYLNRIGYVSMFGLLALSAADLVAKATLHPSKAFLEESFLQCATKYTSSISRSWCHLMGVDQYERFDTVITLTVTSLVLYGLYALTLQKWAKKVNNRSLTQPEIL